MQKRFSLWLSRRIPQHQHQQINHSNIFIIPSRFGASLVLFMLLLFLLGTNYQNNVIILLSYLLVSFFIVVLIHSFLNLSGLRFYAATPLQGFVGSQLQFPLTITSTKARFNIAFSFAQMSGLAKQNSTPSAQKSVMQLAEGEQQILVPYNVDKRGEYELGRMLIISEYGFGLFKTWTRLDFGQKITAFPKPIADSASYTQSQEKSENTSEDTESYQDSFQPGQDEFHQLQHYQQGEPLSRVAWKQVARGQGWLTKQYQQALSGKLQLDFDRLPAGTLEQKLSWLSYAIKDCNQQQMAFSLKLPNQMIEHDHSAEHTLRCLTALARF